MKCHLCKQEKKLIKAHIIPSWCFKYLYDKKEKKRKPLIFANLYSDSITHAGIYDKEILCEECDSFLGDYDNYGKKVLLQTKIETLRKENNTFYLIKNINTHQLAIFFLSVLWRASISKRHEFSKVDIGPYKDKICFILNNVKNNQNFFTDLEKFPIVVRKFTGSNYSDLIDKNLQLPVFKRIDGINFYLLYFPKGFIIYIKVDKRNLPEFLKPFCLKGKTMLMLEKDFENSEEFKFMVRAITNKKSRK